MCRLILQWHITNRCNKRCAHCYQEKYQGEELSTSELINQGKEYIKLLNRYNKEKGTKQRGQINLTGGEPFVREDIWELLDFFKENKSYFDFGILTNGSLLTVDVVERLKEYNPKMVQVSIDGGKDTHDKLRGQGSYNEVIKALKLLNKYKIKALVSFTANNKNYKEYPLVAKAARKGRAYKVWTDRLVPTNGNINEEIKTLNKEEVVEYINIIGKEQDNILNKIRGLKVLGERSLQFLNGKGLCYKCSAGDGLIILLENGDVMPCRRLPITAGNIKDNSLMDIYYKGEVFNRIRNKDKSPKGCEECGFLSICGGGAKCISYGVYGSYEEGDYGCIYKKMR